MIKMERNLMIISIIMIIIAVPMLVRDTISINETGMSYDTAKMLGYSGKEVSTEVDLNLVNLMIDGSANGTIAIYEYFEGLMGSDAEGSNLIWGSIAQISGYGSSFQSLVRGFARDIKSMI